MAYYRTGSPVITIEYNEDSVDLLRKFSKINVKDAKVCRIDADTSKEKGVYEEVYRKMKNKEIDILIGTHWEKVGWAK